MAEAARVVLALEAPDIAEEVMQFIDRQGGARVVATASDDRQLIEAVRQLEPDAVVAQPSLVSGSEALRGHPLLAIETRESVGSLRAAITAGAQGFFVWPGERDALIGAVGKAVIRPVGSTKQGAILAVHGSRGGVGATSVATHVSAAFSRLGRTCLLLDLDLVYGDVSRALGAPVEGVKSLSDIEALIEELAPEHVMATAWPYTEGCSVLLAPSPGEASFWGESRLRSVIAASAEAADVVVLHLPAAVDEITRMGFEIADKSLEVLSLDVGSFRSSGRALEALGSSLTDGRTGFVVNRAGRSEITANDVARVFATEPIAVVPYERAMERTREQGRLMPAKSRIGRVFDRLAATVAQELGR